MRDANACAQLQHRVLAVLEGHPAPHTRIAFSGGLDSHVLLHIVAGAIPVSAVHVHHGLQPAADQWVQHVTEVCDGLGVALRILHVDARPGAGESPEAAARDARYRAMASVLGAGERLLVAHHADDQAETVLLALLRGSGPAGLAGMALRTALGPGWLMRPLLHEPRSLLERYARFHGLLWVDDPSNADTRLDRNLLRREVLPALRRRWPSLSRTLGRSARLCGEARDLLDALADEDLQGLGARAGTLLPLGALRAMAPPRRRNLLRHWLALQGVKPPAEAHLRRIETEFLHSAADRQPRLELGDRCLVRHRDALQLIPAMETAPAHWCRSWDGRQELWLPDGSRLLLVPARGTGLDARRLAGAELEVRLRGGGERFHPAGRARSCTVKHWLQAQTVPPWERAWLPLLWAQGELVAVADLAVAAGWQAATDGEGLLPVWQRRIDPDLADSEAAP